MPTQPKIVRHENRSVELTEFLSHEDTGCLGTTDGIDAFTAIVFYVYENGRLYFKSRTGSNHSTHLRSHPQASFAVFLKSSTYDSKYGAQLLGRARRIQETDTMQRVVKLYGECFAGATAKLPSIKELCSDEIASTFYQFEIEKFKIIDEDGTRNRTMLNYEDFQHQQSA